MPARALREKIRAARRNERCFSIAFVIGIFLASIAFYYDWGLDMKIGSLIVLTLGVVMGAYYSPQKNALMDELKLRTRGSNKSGT